MSIHRRNFLEQFAKQMNIAKPSDWGKVGYETLANSGGSSILVYYDGSIFRMLKDIFPGTEK